jgi:hypothetical protein
VLSNADLDILGSLTTDLEMQKTNPQKVLPKKATGAAFQALPTSDPEEVTGAADPSHIAVVLDTSSKIRPVAVRRVPWYASVKTILVGLCVLLLLGLVIIMVVTLAKLSIEGSQWMSSATVSLTSQAMTNLGAIAVIKSTFVQVGVGSDVIYCSYSGKHACTVVI